MGHWHRSLVQGCMCPGCLLVGRRTYRLRRAVSRWRLGFRRRRPGQVRSAAVRSWWRGGRGSIWPTEPNTRSPERLLQYVKRPLPSSERLPRAFFACCQAGGSMFCRACWLGAAAAWERTPDGGGRSALDGDLAWRPLRSGPRFHVKRVRAGLAGSAAHCSEPLLSCRVVAPTCEGRCQRSGEWWAR